MRFELTIRKNRTLVFETSAFNHSATPPKIKIPSDTACFKGKTIPKSAVITIVIKNGNGNTVVTGSKNIPHNANTGYDFQLNIGQLNVNIWYDIELTFTHTDGQKIVQNGQVMRINP